MPASSVPYSTRLRVDRTLRAAVAFSGVVLALAGLLVIRLLPVSAWQTALLALVWTGMSAGELWRIASAWRAAADITLYADGTLSVAGPYGRQSGSLMHGSLVLRRGAWLRIRLDGGRDWGEPVRPLRPNGEDWRRLQVIARHLTACR